MNNSFADKIKNFLFILLVMVVLSGIVYYNRDSYKIAYENILVTVGINGPCKQPIKYSIGTFDKRFGISREQFLGIAAEATRLWDNSVDKELFQYSETGKLKVNLIYDNRQKATSEMQSIDASISGSTDSYNSLKSDYRSLQSQYNQEKVALESMNAAYGAHKIAYEQQVSSWNRHSGDQYTILENQRQSLNAEATALNQASRSFNTLVDRLNSTAKHLNSMASNINQNVATYNRIGVSTGLEFEEGEYVRDETGERINIYQYSDHGKLFRVLAHEFGHALELDHVNDPKAIMYMLNKDSSTTLAPDDISAIKNICGIK